MAVTGAEGFIGSHLVEALVGRGHRVRAMVHYNAFGFHGWLDTLAPEIRASVQVRLGDVRDAATVDALVQDVDAVYHLAALIAVPYSYLAPRSYVDTNVGGTLNVLDAARRSQVRRVVNTSTSEVYGTAQVVPMTERHPLSAQSPYAASKIAADQLALSYHRSYELPVTVLRPFNTYGPRQSTRAMVPTVVRQLLDGPEIGLGSLSPTRDLLYVADTVAAFLAVGEADDAAVVGEVLHAGTGVETSMRDLVAAVAALLGVDPDVTVAADRLRPVASEVQRLVCDIAELTARTGWGASNPLPTGLARTVSWFRDDHDRARHPADRFL